MQIERKLGIRESDGNPPNLLDLPPEKGPLAVEEVQAAPASKPSGKIEDWPIDGGRTDKSGVRTNSEAADARRPEPVIVYIDGAGWVFGSAHSHDRLIRELAVGAQAALLVFPNYSLSPDVKYPTAIEEIYARRQVGL